MDIDEKAVNKPKTIDEAAVFIIAAMSDDDKKVVRETEKDDLIQYHFTWGMGIRKGLCLHAADSEIMKSNGCFHPVDYSVMPIEVVWNLLKGKN